MKVYGFSNETEGLTDIYNTLKAMQKFVGGRIEKVSFTEEIDLICNEEGKCLVCFQVRHGLRITSLLMSYVETAFYADLTVKAILLTLRKKMLRLLKVN